MKSIYLALGLTALPLLAMAEDNTVIVSASRYEQPITNTLAAVTVLTADDIRQSGQDNLSSLLTSVTSMANKTSGGLGSQSKITSRGFGHGRMIVLINGVRATNITSGAATLEAISLADVERIEIVRGPVSSLYGADGMGGVIQIFTRTDDRADDYYVSAEYGSNNLQQLRAGFAASAGDSRFEAGIGYLLTDGFDNTTNQANGNDDDDGFTQWSGNAAVTTQLSDDLELQLAHNQTSGTVEFDNEYCTSDCAAKIKTDMTLMTSSVGLNYQLADDWQLNTSVGRNLDDKFNHRDDSEFITESLSYNVLLAGELNALDLSLGTDAAFDSVDSTTDYDETERSNFGVYGQGQYRFGDQRLGAGARVDANSDYGNVLTGNLSLSSFVIGDIEAIASYGTAFNAPSFDYLYYPGYNNPDLDPETSGTAELALRQLGERYSWRFSLYRTDATDLIVSTASTNYTPENVDEAVLQGIEAEYQQRLASTDFNINAGYVDARDDDDDRLSDTPDWTANLGVTQHLGVTALSLELHGEGERISSDETLDGFVTVNTAVDYRFGSEQTSRLYARLDNLLDKDYVINEGYNTAGRTFKVGIEYHL